MKKTKILTVLGVLLAMGITACGGNKTSSKSEEKSSQSQQPVSSSVAPAPASSSEPASVPDTSAPEQVSSSSSAVAHVHVWDMPNKEELAEDYALIEQPTCTEAGSYNWTCECGQTKTETIKKLGHDFGEWTNVPDHGPTCTKGTEQQRECSRCDEVETKFLDDALGHEWGETPIATEKNADGKDVVLKACTREDAKCIAIAFDDYSNKSTDFGDASGYDSVPEALRNSCHLLSKGSTISWKINLDKAITGARISFAAVSTNSSHSTQEFAANKNQVKVNDGEFVTWSLASGGNTYGDAGLKLDELTYVSVATIDLVEGENTITLNQGNGGYRLLFGGEVRIEYAGEAVPVTPFTGYNATFTVEHCKVLVYSTKAYETETPVETNTCIAKDEEGNIAPYDPEDIELQPQVSFKVVCDEGYSVTVNNITITPRDNYKNLKQNPDSNEGQDDIFRITKVQGDIAISIVATEGEQAKGYTVTFVPTNCTIKVYVGPKNADGTNLDTPEDGVYYARVKDSPYAIGFTTPQLNFEVVCEPGYVFEPVITDNKVDFITHPDTTKDGYNKFSDKGGYYNLTKVDDNITITITAVPQA